MINSEQQIKFVFTGCVGAGKTTAISVISEIPVVSTEAKPTEKGVVRRKATTTVAMDYGEISLSGDKKLRLYGTPGQRRFDFMCHILTQGALGMVILIDNSHEDPLAELDYFLNLNAAFLQRNAAVIGVTHYDITTEPSVDDYYQALSDRGDPWPVFHVDAREVSDVTLLLNTLVTMLEYG